MESATVVNEAPLVLSVNEDIGEDSKELDLKNPDLVKKADMYVAQLISVEAKDLGKQQALVSAVESMGLELQRSAASKSSMLQGPLRDLQATNQEGKGGVADSLIDLKMQVESLDPSGMDFSAGFLTRLVGWIPGVGTPMKKYFSKFENAQTVIDAIINSLEKGKDQLHRDNISLVEDQKEMREMTYKLTDQVQLATIIDQKLDAKMTRELANDEGVKKFVGEELIFPLRQRIQDLQQQLAVNQQGVLALEVVIRNNKELIRGVNRALNVTITALEVAVTVATAVAHQKIVLDKINALNATTDNIIAGTAKALRTTVAETNKLASSSSLSMETLRQAFVDTRAAMDDISTFRMNALPKMATAILEMDNITKEAENCIQKMEKGNVARPKLAESETLSIEA